MTTEANVVTCLAPDGCVLQAQVVDVNREVDWSVMVRKYALGSISNGSIESNDASNGMVKCEQAPSGLDGVQLLKLTAPFPSFPPLASMLPNLHEIEIIWVRQSWGYPTRWELPISSSYNGDTTRKPTTLRTSMLPPQSNLALLKTPSIFCALSNLRRISIHRTPIKIFPGLYFCSPQLEELDLQDNHKLRHLPRCFARRFPNLRTLRLRRNRLVSLPPEMDTLSELKVLEVEGNQISAVPFEIFKKRKRPQEESTRNEQGNKNEKEKEKEHEKEKGKGKKTRKRKKVKPAALWLWNNPYHVTWECDTSPRSKSQKKKPRYRIITRDEPDWQEFLV